MRSCTLEEATHVPAQAHRPGGVSFRHLLAGTDGEPDNYSLSLVDVAQHYSAPRHRHNFEQVRVMLSGSFGFGPGAVQHAGSVGYFCEGSYYTQHGDGPSTTLLLQCGGASGEGYMGFDNLMRGNQALLARGHFHDGVYTWLDEHGKKHNQDGYEAVWQHIRGRRIRYPKPRYQAPVILSPEHFSALPVAPGVALKRLGCFNERGLGLALWCLRPNALLRLDKAQRRELLYVHQGDVSQGDVILGPKRLSEGSAIEVLEGETLALSAGPQGAALMGFSLPSFA